MRKVSIMMPAATPKPIWRIWSLSPVTASTAKVPARIMPAAVTVPPVRAMASRTASGSDRFCASSRMRRITRML